MGCSCAPNGARGGDSAETGPYSSKWFMDHTRRALGANWNKVIDIFDKLDPKKLFCNTFLENFMVKVDANGHEAGGAVAAAPNNNTNNNNNGNDDDDNGNNNNNAVPNANHAPDNNNQQE